MILLDTCVVSEAIRPEPAPQVLSWIGGLSEQRVYLPCIVLGELLKGVRILDPGQKRNALSLWLEQLRERFRDRILPIDEQTAIEWGALTARMQSAGRTLPAIDSLLGAQALRYHALFATRNTRDYEGTGVETIDPWASEERG